MGKKSVSFEEEFAHPGNEYRAVPFWAWNGKLDPEELRRQVHLLHDMGMGGFFMHARVGLNTPYLSDEWFECVRICIEEAEKLQMRAWLYDEDRWPSGAAGGIVTADPRYRQRQLVVYELDPIAAGSFRPDGECLGIWAGCVDGRNLSGVRQVDSLRSPLAPGECFLYMQMQLYACCSWYNNQTYLDTLSHEAVQKFIEVTHEAYRRHFGPYFGNRIPGIFTDEPHYGNLGNKVADNAWSVPWTDKLPELFRARHGYEISGLLPELFYRIDGEAVSALRLDFIDTLTFLFTDAFARQIGAWCEKNNLLFTGHVLEEDRLSHQTRREGSAMRFYEYMQAPGIDLLTEHWRYYDTAIQLASVARQFNRQWRLTELYGCTGWDFPFAGHKAVGDWQAALGVNLRCPHLAWYSMAAEAKRDYPASISYQSPWFREYRALEDYFARVNLTLTRGREVRDLLVVNPVESTWTLTGKDWSDDPEVAAWDRKRIRLRDTLLTAGIAFDYGDEEMMARHCRVTEEEGRAVLYVGCAAYYAVVIPEMLTIRASTVRILEEFAARGGRVVYFNRLPAFVGGRKRAAACRPVGPELKRDRKKLVELLAPVARRVALRDERGQIAASVLYQLRQDEDADYLFVCNTGHTEPQLSTGVEADRPGVLARRRGYPVLQLDWRSEKAGGILELDAATGKIYRVEAERSADGWRWQSTLAPLQTRIFIAAAQPGTAYPLLEKWRERKRIVLNPAKWEFRRNDENVLLLDCCRIQVDGEALSEPGYVLTWDDRLRRHIGCEPRGAVMVQPWVKQRDGGRAVSLRLSMEFGCRKIPDGPVWLGIEFPELYRMSLNGHAVSAAADAGWWCDRSLRKIPLNNTFFCLGRNELTLECRYDGRHPGLEFVYLLGGFGVQIRKHAAVMTGLPPYLTLGDWCNQKLPFYSGAITYRTTAAADLAPGERLFVRLPECEAACVRVWVQGADAGLIATPPYELDITGEVDAREFELALEVISSRRNSHGPFHMRDRSPNWIEPSDFNRYEVAYYRLRPYGLIAAPELIIREGNLTNRESVIC